MPTHTTKRYGLGPFETRLGGFTSFSGSQAEELRYGYYLPFSEGVDVWGEPYILEGQKEYHLLNRSMKK